ncbi:MAG: flagellar biosynthesis protein FliQ [Myxococcota bacterium]
MDLQDISALFRTAIQTALLVSLPILSGATLLGLGISILQAATQVNEQTLTFVPKILLVLVLFAALYPWMMQTLVDFSVALFDEVARVGGG